ncbi:periplasmic binding family protein, partial [Vibrio parahaemolyticus V-223/04]
VKMYLPIQQHPILKSVLSK